MELYINDEIGNCPNLYFLPRLLMGIAIPKHALFPSPKLSQLCILTEYFVFYKGALIVRQPDARRAACTALGGDVEIMKNFIKTGAAPCSCIEMGSIA